MRFLFIIIIIIITILCTGCTEVGNPDTSLKKKDERDFVLLINNEVLVTGEEISLYMDEIAYSHPDNLCFDELKELAVERAIVVAVIDIYFEEKGIVALDEEIDTAIDRHAWRCGMTYQAFLTVLSENFRKREIRRCISTEVREQKLIVKMMKSGVFPGVAREKIGEEIDERIKNVEVLLLRPLRREIWI